MRLNVGRSSQMALPPRLVFKVAGALAGRVLRGRGPGEPGIGVQREPGAGRMLSGRLAWKPDAAGAAAAALVARGQEQAQRGGPRGGRRRHRPRAGSGS